MIECKLFDAVSGERRRSCGWMRCEYSTCDCACTSTCSGTNKQHRLHVASPALLAVAHCSEAGSAQTRHPFFPAATGPSDPTAATRLKHKSHGDMETRPPGRYRYPRRRLGGPCWSRYPSRLVPVGSQKRCYPPATHANALQEPEPRRLQWRSNPARSTVAGAGLPPQQRLRPHGRSTF